MFDIIIIGSGISGLNFALRAAEQKNRVLIVTKKRAASSSTNFAQGGIAAVLSRVDDFKKHVHDTLKAGCFHNNKRAVSYMVRHGPNAIARLIELGVPFATSHGELMLTRKGAPSRRANSLASLRLGLEGAHSERRIAFVSDYTGQAIEKVLVKKVRRNPRITLYEHTFAADLLVKNKACHGVRVVRNNKFENIYGGRVIIATGGTGQLFERTTNPSIATADGIAMAVRIGAQVRDMEFIQFHPTAFFASGKTRFLISEAVRGEGGVLRNAKGERFMPRYHKLAELAPRDIVSRAIFEEEKKGAVFLDLRHKTQEYQKARFPQIHKKLHSYGFNMAKDLIPISPAAHYLCGGIRTNLRGETGIKNLYAFGEVAWTGVHGANRLASNSLLEALVFSDRIIKKIKKTMHKSTHFPKLKYRSLSAQEKIKVPAVRKKLQKTMFLNVGIIRSNTSLKEAAHDIATLKKTTKAIRGNEPEFLELQNMLMVAELIIKAALKRKKSLGCHWRKN